MTLPKSMRWLRLSYWLFMVFSQAMIHLTQSDVPFLAILLSLVFGGLLLEQILLVLAHLYSRGSRFATWTMWCVMGLLCLPGTIFNGLNALSLGIGVSMLLMMMGVFSLLVGKTATLELNDRVLRMEEWRPIGLRRDDHVVKDRSNHVLTIPLEDIESVTIQERKSLRGTVGHVVLKLADRDVAVWSAPLRAEQYTWLAKLISERVQQRTAALVRDGHDLDESVQVPPALQALRHQP